MIRVLVVDDSTFFRKRLKEIFESDPLIKVIGEAKNGQEAIQLCQTLKPSVVTMDVDMPVMDGITALTRIMEICPTPVMMLSSLTHEGASATFKALEAGAIDFLPKNFDDIARKRENAIASIIATVKTVAHTRIQSKFARRITPTTASTASTTSRSISSLQERRAVSSPLSSARPSLNRAVVPNDRVALNSYQKINELLHGKDPAKPAATIKFNFGQGESKTTVYKKSGKKFSIVAIGSSTGGPIALGKLIPSLPKLSMPVVIIQHMPAAFTKTFAQRLDGISKNHVVEAQDGDVLEAGTVYIAPGGKQLIFEKAGDKTRARVIQDSSRVAYNPCVDISFASISQIYGGKVLAIILTGMGSDGCEGCRILKKNGAQIWAQNEDTCVVYGMPQAIVNSNLADEILPLEEFAPCIVKELS